MADPTFFRATLARRALPWLGRFATLAVVALLAWLGANAFWQLASPATPMPAMVVDTDALRVAQTVAARHLFGKEQSTPGTVAGVKSAANLKLQGVFAPAKPGSFAIAIISSQGKPAVAVREGEEVIPGVTLHRVLPRSVEIDQSGRIATLEFPDPPKRIGPPAFPARPRSVPTNQRRRPTS